MGLSETCFNESEYIVHQPYRGLYVAYHARKVVYTGKSRYQKIDIIDNEAYGLMLFLNNNLQHTQFDSEIFNRALIGPVLARRPRRVLVLGGGSGQTVKSLLRARSVESVTVVELDEEVVEACKRHIPGVRAAIEDPRTRIIIGDAFRFVREDEGGYDALVADLTEEVLDELTAFEAVYRFAAERCGGLCSAYIGSMAPQTGGPERVRRHLEATRRYFAKCSVRRVFIPSFGSVHAFLRGLG